MQNSISFPSAQVIAFKPDAQYTRSRIKAVVADTTMPLTAREILEVLVAENWDWIARAKKIWVHSCGTHLVGLLNDAPMSDIAIVIDAAQVQRHCETLVAQADNAAARASIVLWSLVAVGSLTAIVVGLARRGRCCSILRNSE